MKETLMEIFNTLPGKTIVLYGASGNSKYAYELLPRYGVKPHFFADTYSYGDSFYGLDVLSPDILMALDAETSVCVFITCSWAHEIYKDLIARGFSGDLYTIPTYSDEDEGMVFPLEASTFADFLDDVNTVRKKLSDAVSKQVLDCLIDARSTYNPKGYVDAYDLSVTKSGVHQYFPSEVTNNIGEVHLVDCGAYDGDTIRLANRLNIPIEKAYCLEPDKNNFSTLVNNVGQASYIETINAGAWSTTGKLQFIHLGNGTSHMVTTDSGESIKVYAIDDLLAGRKATYIKMDIEGSEMAALQGAVSTITRFRPTLAICVYHKFYDITRIPLYLMKQLHGYRFLLRQHSGYQETVLYCIPIK